VLASQEPKASRNHLTVAPLGLSKTILIPATHQGSQPKIDKNIIRNSSPAKTNLERLNGGGGGLRMTMDGLMDNRQAHSFVGPFQSNAM